MSVLARTDSTSCGKGLKSGKGFQKHMLRKGSDQCRDACGYRECNPSDTGHTIHRSVSKVIPLTVIVICRSHKKMLHMCRDLSNVIKVPLVGSCPCHFTGYLK